MTKKERVLFWTNELDKRKCLLKYLSTQFEVIQAVNEAKAYDVIQNENVGLLVLSLRASQEEKRQICKRVKAKGQLPILMLAERGDIKDRIHGFFLGVDDYLIQPFKEEELLYRAKSLLKRATLSRNLNHSEERIELFDMELDKEDRRVYVKNKALDLTRQEFEILYILATNPGKVFTEDMLRDRIEEKECSIETHIRRIQQNFKRNNLSFTPIKKFKSREYVFQPRNE